MESGGGPEGLPAGGGAPWTVVAHVQEPITEGTVGWGVVTIRVLGAGWAGSASQSEQNKDEVHPWGHGRW